MRAPRRHGRPAGLLVGGRAAAARLTAVILLLLSAGCTSGRIGTFTVAPNPACLDQTVYVTYEATEGDPYLSASPSVEEDLRTEPSPVDFGVKTIRARRNTTFTLVARGTESSEERSIELRVLDPGQPVVISALGACVGAEPSWVGSLFPDRWPEGAVVERVTNPDLTAAVDVVHEGRTAAIASGMSSAAFAGTRLIGDWVLRPVVEDSLWAAWRRECGALTGPRELPAVSIEVEWACSE